MPWAAPSPRTVAYAVREEAAGQDHVIDAVATQPLEHEDDERAVDQRDDRLWYVER
jgi:hypothetical protein